MKKTTYLLFALFTIFTACKKSNQEILSEIDAFQQSEKMGTPEGLKELALLQEEYGLNVTDSIGNAQLYAAALYNYHGQDSTKAISLNNEYLLRDDSSELYRNIACNQANLLKGKRELGQATSLIYSVMDKHILDASQWRDAAMVIEEKIKKSGDVEDYIGLSKVYTATGNIEGAINQLDSAIVQYPDFDKRANLILRAGFLGWEHLKDHTKAEKYYTQLVSEYPEHPQVKEIETILNNGYLKLTDREILEQLRTKNK